MGIGCGARCLKFCLFIFNLVFLICGLICVCIGIWLRFFDKNAVDNLAAATAKVQGYEMNAGLRDLATKPEAVRLIGTLLAVGGVIVIFVAFLGCCGAAKEWRPLLCCYGACLMVILATEIAAAIYAAAMHGHAFDKEILQASLKLYNGTEAQKNKKDNTVLVKSAWDTIMLEKECCGVESKVGEFNESGWFILTNKKNLFPPACCPRDHNGNLMPECPTVSRHGEGCYMKIKESSQLVVVVWTVAVIALIQVFGIVVSFCLCNALSPESAFF